MITHLLLPFQFRQDFFSQLLAQLDAPLVEAEDIPDDALREDLVFVKGDEAAEGAGGELLQQDGIGGAVAFEGFEGQEKFGLLRCFALLFQFGAHFFRCFAHHQGLGLGEEVGQQLGVVVADGVVADGRGNKIAGDQLGALVDELVESVLPVGARLAPDDGAGLVAHLFPVAAHVFAVALHVALLEIGGEAVQVLVVRQDRLRLGAEEVVVPDADQGQQDGNVAVERRIPEVDVHHIEALQQLPEVVEADGTGNGQPDGGGERIAAAHPVPEFEHIHGVDAELRHLFPVGGSRHEVLRNMAFLPGMIQEPPAGSMGVGHGFLSSKGLGSDDEEGGSRLYPFERFRNMGAIHIGDKMHVDARLPVGPQGFSGHHRPQVGTADADIDDIGDALAGITLPPARNDLVGKGLHLLKYGIHRRHDVLPIYVYRFLGAVAQGHMQYRPPFRLVDRLSGEHLSDAFAKPALLRQIQQQVHRLCRDAVFGEIDQDIFEFQRELFKAPGVFGKELLHVAFLQELIMGVQFFPGFGLGWVLSVQHADHSYLM